MHFDTIAFDVREEASMLFFAKTTASGEISEYLLVMKAEEDPSAGVYLELNGEEFSGHDLLSRVTLTDNVLTLDLKEASAYLDGAEQLVVSFDRSPENDASLEHGLMRVLGDLLDGGNV